MTTMKKYYKQIDVLRGIAITLVLFGHSIIVFPIDLNAIGWCNFLHTLVSSVHMPLFFLISGFCYSFKNPKDFYIKKIKRILVPYSVFLISGFAVGIIFPSLVNDSQGLNGLLNSLLYGTNYWFLYTLFLIFLIFPLIEKAMVNKAMQAVVLSVLFVLSLFNFWPELLSINKVVWYISFFATGYFIKQNLENVKTVVNKLFSKKVAGFVCSVVLSGLWIALVFVDWKYFAELNYILISTVKIAEAFLGIAAISLIVNLTVNYRSSDAFVSLGKYSLQLYLLDGYMLVISRTLLIKVLGITNPVIIITGIYIFTLVPSYLLIRFIVDRFKVFRFLFGIV